DRGAVEADSPPDNGQNECARQDSLPKKSVALHRQLPRIRYRLCLGYSFHFERRRTMDVEQSESRLASVASAIADPARARMLCCLLDGRARTATELAVVAQKSPSTASTHFQKLL